MRGRARLAGGSDWWLSPVTVTGGSVTAVLQEVDRQSALCSYSHQGNSFRTSLLVSSVFLGQKN